MRTHPVVMFRDSDGVRAQTLSSLCTMDIERIILYSIVGIYTRSNNI